MQNIRKFFLFVALLLVQVLVCNNIHLFHIAMPLIYVYFFMLFRRGYPRWAILLWCFFMGLAVDAFANTPGVATASATLIGFLQPYIFELFLQRDSEEDIEPSIASMGFGKFAFYAFIITFVYCLVFFSLEMFNFFNWIQWLECLGGSAALTYVLVLTIENLRKHVVSISMLGAIVSRVRIKKAL